MKTLILNKEHYLFFILLLLSACLLLFFITPWHNWGGDFSSYIMQANSILNNTVSTFITDNSWMLENSDFSIGPVAYPWGFPLFLASIIAFFGSSIFVLKSSICLAFLGLLCTLIFFFRKKLSILQTVSLFSTFAFNTIILNNLNNILSDIPFLFISTLAVLYLDSLLQRKALTARSLCIFAALAFIATTLRSNGLLLLFLLPMVQATTFPKFRSNTLKTKMALLLTPYIFYIFLYLTFSSMFPAAGGGHLAFFKDVTLSSIWNNMLYYAKLPMYFIPLPYFLSSVIYAVSLIFFILGIKKHFFKDYILILYSAMTLGLYILWPALQGIRFIYPIIPFYIYFCIIGISQITKYKFNKFNYYGIIALFCISCIINIQMTLPPSPHKQGPYSAYAQEAFEYISKNTEKNAVFTFFKPRVFRMKTGRFAILKYDADTLNYDYILYYTKQSRSISKENLKSLIDNKKISLVFKNEYFYLYKVINKKII